MKGIKKILSGTIAVAMLATTFPSMQVFAANKLVTGDNFDSYTPVELDLTLSPAECAGIKPSVTGLNTDIDAGNVPLALGGFFGETEMWSAKKTTGNYGENNTAGTGIIDNHTTEEADGNILAIEGRVDSKKPQNSPAVGFMEPVSLEDNVEYIYSVDFYNTCISPKNEYRNTGVFAALRFNVNGNSFYELAVHAGGIIVNKVVDGTFTELSKNNLSAPPEKWHTMSASVLGGRISWKVTEPDGTILGGGTVIDSSNPLTVIGSKQELASRGQFSAYSLFDNFKIEKLEVTEDDGSFSAFTAMTEPVHASTTEDVQVADSRWYIKQSKTGQWAGFGGANPDFGIVADPSTTTIEAHGNVLMIEAAAANTSYSEFPMMYNNMMNAAKGEDNLYTFDFKRCSSDNGEAGGGIRFNYAGEGNTNSYYELYIYAGATRLSKKTADGGYEQLDATVKTFNSTGGYGPVWTDGNKFFSNTWYKVQVRVIDGIIRWDVYDEAGYYIQTGEYDDSTSYLESDVMQTVFFAGGQNDAMTYFDNISKTVIPQDDGSFSYAATGAVKADSYADKALAGNWYIKKNVDGQKMGDGLADIEIAADPLGGTRGNVLKIQAKSLYNTPQNYPMVYNKGMTIREDGAYVYTFDYYRSTSESGGGIRFNYSGIGTNYGTTTFENGANYYELQFGRSQSVILSKCVNGVYTTLTEGTDFSVIGDKKLGAGMWYSVELIVDGGNISWKAASSGSVYKMEGSYTDNNPLPIVGTHFAFFADGQYVENACFDNVSVKKIAEDNGSLDNLELTDDIKAFSKIDRYLAGDWSIRGINGNENPGHDSKATFTVTEAPKADGNAFKIDARAGYSTSSIDNQWAVPTIYNRSWSVDSAAENTYTFDFYTTDSRIGPVVRFDYSKVSDSNKSFYELNLKGAAGGNVTTLSKLVNGETRAITELEAVIEGETAFTKDTWYNVKLVTKGGEINWTLTKKDDNTVLHTGSYTDSEPLVGTNLMTLFGAQGQGDTYVYLDNIYLNPKEETEPPVDPDPPIDPDPEPPVKDDETYLTVEGDYRIFTDKFGGYDAENAVIDEANPVNAIKNDLTIAENTAATWKLSEVNTSSGKPYAFVDAYAKRLKLVGITRNYTKPYSSVVNLELKDGSAKSLDSLEATVIPVDGGRTGIRIAVSADEKTYYEFGRGNWHDFRDDFNPDSNTGTPTGYPKRAPYVVKCVNGVREVIAYPTDTSYSNEAWATTWKIAIADGNISITAEQKRNDLSIAKTWTHTIQADDTIMDGFKYPLTIWGATTNVQTDDVTVKYVPQKKVYTDNGDGTAEINILAAQYDKSGADLTAVTSFYNSNDEFISADERSVGAESTYSLNVPANADYAKILLWAGAPEDGKLVGEIVSNDAGPAAAAEDKIIIAAVGDSLTGNDGFESNHTWPTKLNYLLGEDYIVKNYGKPSYQLMNGNTYSYTTTEEYQNSLQSEADIVIIMLGTNDSGGWDGAVDKEARSQKFYDDYVSLINSYRAMPSKPEIIIAVPPIRGTAEEPLTNADTYIKPIIKKLSADLNIPYVDMYSLVTDYNLLYDGTHFYDAGYFQFAQHFYEAVAKLVDVETSDSEVVIKSTASFESNAIVGIYDSNKLKAVKKTSVNVLSNVPYTIDISDMDINSGDTVKVMFMDDEIEPYTYASPKSVKNVYQKDGKLIIAGNTAAGADAFTVVYDLTGAVVFAQSSIASEAGYYEFVVELASGTYNVVYGANGTAQQKSATIQ